MAGVAGDLVGLHATDPASVMLAARARVEDIAPADVERALYEERSVVRMLGMRRTMFVVPVELMAVVQAACTAALVPGERRKLVAFEAILAGASENYCSGDRSDFSLARQEALAEFADERLARFVLARRDPGLAVLDHASNRRGGEDFVIDHDRDGPVHV